MSWKDNEDAGDLTMMGAADASEFFDVDERDDMDAEDDDEGEGGRDPEAESERRQMGITSL